MEAEFERIMQASAMLFTKLAVSDQGLRLTKRFKEHNLLEEFGKILHYRSHLSRTERNFVRLRYFTLLSMCDTRIVKYVTGEFSDYYDCGNLKEFVGKDNTRYTVTDFISIRPEMSKLVAPMQIITKAGNYYTGWIYPDRLGLFAGYPIEEIDKVRILLDTNKLNDLYVNDIPYGEGQETQLVTSLFDSANEQAYNKPQTWARQKGVLL